MPKYFDIHSHLNFKDYESDLDDVIERLRETETYTIVVGTDYESSKKAVELAEKYPEIYASIGIHPVDKTSEIFDETLFAELVKSKKVVAIGECGLDFYHAKKSEDFERQKNLFLIQVDFALNHGKPLMIHARDAYVELLEILEPLKKLYGHKLRGNIHFFAGDWSVAERFLALDFTLSFTGVITFARNYDEVIKKAPLGSIMSETDAPFATPAPHRGTRNEPSYVQEVVKKIAEIRGEAEEEVREGLVQNALNMVG